MRGYVSHERTTRENDTQTSREETETSELNQDNNLNNTSDKYMGNEIEAKEDGVFRIYGCNPNGINLDINGGDYNELLEEMDRFQADTFCLYETNLDTTKTRVKTLIYENTQKVFDHKAKTTITSSNIPAKNEFKPGGTLIATVGDSAGRVIASGQDNLGRWSHQTLTCK